MLIVDRFINPDDKKINTEKTNTRSYTHRDATKKNSVPFSDSQKMYYIICDYICANGFSVHFMLMALTT